MQVPYCEGGQVVGYPLVYASFWGPKWADGAHSAQARQLEQFHGDLLKSNFMNVLTQYGISGPGGGAFVGSTFLPWVELEPPATALTVARTEEILSKCIEGRAIPKPSTGLSNVLFIYLDETLVFDDGEKKLNFAGALDVGFHDFFETEKKYFYYAVVAYFPDVNSTTVVASHEFAEMTTDPHYDAWTPDQGRTEIGDLCEGLNDKITVGTNTWTVQKIWSNATNACVSQAAVPTTPFPSVHTGIAGAQAVCGRGPRPRAQFAAYDRLLPMPPAKVNEDGESSFDERELRAYVNRLFYPHHPEEMIAQLPETLVKEMGRLLYPRKRQ